MVPRLDTVDQAAESVRHMLYPPHGDRGVATYNRSCRWGMDRRTLTEPEQETLGIIQIETLRRWNPSKTSPPRTASTSSSSARWTSPTPSGVPLQLDSNVFQEALQRVVAAAQLHNKAAGILAVDGMAAAKYVRQGFRFVAIGSDSTIMAAAFRDAFETARN